MGAAVVRDAGLHQDNGLVLQRFRSEPGPEVVQVCEQRGNTTGLPGAVTELDPFCPAICKIQTNPAPSKPQTSDSTLTSTHLSCRSKLWITQLPHLSTTSFHESGSRTQQSQHSDHRITYQTSCATGTCWLPSSLARIAAT